MHACAPSAYLHDQLLVKISANRNRSTYTLYGAAFSAAPSFFRHRSERPQSARASRLESLQNELDWIFFVEHVQSSCRVGLFAACNSFVSSISTFILSFPSVVAFSGITSVVVFPTLSRLANRTHILFCVFETPYSLLPFPRPSTNRRGAPAMKRSTHRYQS